MSRDARASAARLNQVFSALSDPTRRAMLARLAKGNAPVSELATPFDMAQPTVSKHLRVLEEVDAWLAPFREEWERRFDRLESFLGARGERARKGGTSKKKETR